MNGGRGHYPPSIARLVDEFAKLPGVGRRTAERLAFHCLASPREEAMGLARAIRDARNNLRACSRCFHVAEGELCQVCSDPGRDRELICVMELPRDAIALEKAGVYRGLYHILQGRLSPSEGTGPGDLRIGELMERLAAAAGEGRPAAEVILATRPTAEGDATAEYLAGELRAGFPGLRVTRLARGLASGTEFEAAAPSSLIFAFQGRRE
ncbi:MAG: recombination mediator RecR [Planctomycetota bacterium]|jgi:recombination protein RecR|nr:recombination mediator RecR [Planctomycetota bacterium]